MNLFPPLAASHSAARPRTLLLSSRLVVLALFATLAACANTRGGSIDYGVQNFTQPDAVATPVLDVSYKIAPLDTLTVRVFQFEDLSGDYEVDLTGNIAMPLVGNVRVVDMTPVQLQAALAQKLSEKYLQSPDVSVGIKESAGRNLTVEGSVRQPGMYPVKGPMTLLQAVALARGTDENSNPRRTAIFRTIDGQRMAAAFDLVDIRRGKEKDPEVYSGDIIVVDGSTTRAIYRDLLQTLPIVSLFRPY